MAQVGEPLSCKLKALSSNHTIAQNKEKNGISASVHKRQWLAVFFWYL
jgi:hypothetical protein